LAASTESKQSAFNAVDMLELFAVALAILTVAVLIILHVVRADDVLNGRFFKRDSDQR
jgi:hypothetical protein